MARTRTFQINKKWKLEPLKQITLETNEQSGTWNAHIAIRKLVANLRSCFQQAPSPRSSQSATTQSKTATLETQLQKAEKSDIHAPSRPAWKLEPSKWTCKALCTCSLQTALSTAGFLRDIKSTFYVYERCRCCATLVLMLPRYAYASVPYTYQGSGSRSLRSIVQVWHTCTIAHIDCVQLPDPCSTCIHHVFNFIRIWGQKAFLDRKRIFALFCYILSVFRPIPRFSPIPQKFWGMGKIWLYGCHDNRSKHFFLLVKNYVQCRPEIVGTNVLSCQRVNAVPWKPTGQTEKKELQY